MPTAHNQSGDAFVLGTDGVYRWGRFGAAGLLLAHESQNGTRQAPRFLLALRSPHCHHGDTWALPGGALHKGEPAVDGALREATEELGALPPLAVRTVLPIVTGGWAYHHVLATTDELHADWELGWETERVAWLSPTEVARIPLHPALASTWPTLVANFS